MICKGCEKDVTTFSKENKAFCSDTCYWRYRRLFAGTDVLPGTKAVREVTANYRKTHKLELTVMRKKAEEASERAKTIRAAKRKKVIDFYGGRCACCGETIFEFLQIEHMDGIGKHKTGIAPRAGIQLTDWLIKNNFPSGYQVLCVNCNFVKRFGDPCPHSLIRAGLRQSVGPTIVGGQPSASPTSAPTPKTPIENTLSC